VKAMLRAWAPVVLYASLVLILSLMPAQGGPAGYEDKFYHGTAYLVMACVFLRALYMTRPVGAFAAAVAAVLFASSFGAMVELLQSLTATRTAEVLDALANGAGAAVGSLIYLSIRSRKG